MYFDWKNLKEEAKDIGLTRLQKKTGLSRSHIHKILNGQTEPSLGTLYKLTESLGYELELKFIGSKKSQSELNLFKDEDYLLWSMRHYGAFIVAKDYKNKPPLVDEVLLAALEWGRRLSKVNLALPFFIYKNWSSFDIKGVVNETRQPRYLAYLINLLFVFTNEFHFLEPLAELKKRSNMQFPQRLILTHKNTRENKMRWDKTQNDVANAWKFRTTNSLQALAERFTRELNESVS